MGIAGNNTEDSLEESDTNCCSVVLDCWHSSNNWLQEHKVVGRTVAVGVADSSTESASFEDEKTTPGNVLDHRKSRENRSDPKTSNCYYYYYCKWAETD